MRIPSFDVYMRTDSLESCVFCWRCDECILCNYDAHWDDSGYEINVCLTHFSLDQDESDIVDGYFKIIALSENV